MNGTQTSLQTSSSSAYAVPTAITQGSLSETMNWNSFLGMTGATNPNGATTSVNYDSATRPSVVTNPHGGSTTYTYTNSPPSVTATINTTGDGNGRWTRTTLDGLGRAIKVETGYSTTVKSIAETEYDSCACSPTGKLKRSSMPYAPSGAKWWKTNTYDALGRTVSVQEADHASTTAYVYEGVTVKVTDPAGKWKKFHMNGLGQLWKVEEPRPGGGTYTTTYTYDLVGNLSGVSMPRDGTTQTRTFNYGNGPLLLSATQPENGTTAYTYNADKTLAYKVDADNRKTAYTYDSYKRVTAQRAYSWDSGASQWVEKTCELKEFYYDANIFDANYSQNINGRLAAVRYRPCYTPVGETFYEMYSYSAGGLLLKKRFRVNRNGVDADLDAEWTYDNDGKLVTVRYPLGAVYQHGYDEMGRPKTMIDAGTQTTIVGSATYGPAGELLTMGNETRQYNSRLQVTRITYPTQDWEYKYSATQNNGQITAMKDWTSGEEVNYAYDELKRLASAVTVGPEWGNSYGYDGFGNLLQKNVVKGTAPYMNLSIDPATNKPYGGYSAAGLPTVGAGFDNDNRMISTTAGSSYQEYYAYSPAGKRVWNRGKRDIGGTWVDKEEVWFWGVTGQRMAFYALTATGNPVFTLTSTNLYMGSKLVMSGGVAVKTDRLGSLGKFYPWGEERTPTGVSGEKFATYYHDVQAAMNYADQRWHGTNGRFQVPDPYQASAGAGDPGSWNRFAYVQSDPVNFHDPIGLWRQQPGPDTIQPPMPGPDPNPGGDLEKEWDPEPQKPPTGPEGFYKPKLDKKGRDKFWKAFTNAIRRTFTFENCDSVFALLGVPSLRAGLDLLDTEKNVFDGRLTNVVVGDVDIKATVSGPTATAGAVTVTPSNELYLGSKFFDGSDVAQALILLHEVAHMLGLKDEDLFGSKNLSKNIAEKCFSKRDVDALAQEGFFPR